MARITNNNGGNCNEKTHKKQWHKRRPQESQTTITETENITSHIHRNDDDKDNQSGGRNCDD
jgi:hypothetical protein